jgi:hypothetical protein
MLIRILYNIIDLEMLLENYLNDNGILYVNEDSSDNARFKKPELYKHDTNESSNSSTGEKRAASSSDGSTSSTYIRDDSSLISSRNPKD